jgi:hypothetical protein
MDNQKSVKRDAKTGREKLQRIIEMLTAIEAHQVDPFTLNVDEILQVVKEYFPDWEKTEDLTLDAEAIHHLASVIKLQSEWVKARSTSLYTDPFLLEEKINQTTKGQILSIFLHAWRPVVELEQISIRSLAEAMRYWETLVPLSERWKELAPGEVMTGIVSRDELVKQRILSDKVFSEELEKFWQELKNAVELKGKNGKMRYWDFIGADTYECTVERAFFTSFLITYGYATLEIHPLEELMFIKAFDKPQTKPRAEQVVSVPISVTCDDWQKWKGGEMD